MCFLQKNVSFLGFNKRKRIFVHQFNNKTMSNFLFIIIITFLTSYQTTAHYTQNDMVGEYCKFDDGVHFRLILNSDSSFQFRNENGCFWLQGTKGNWKMKKDTLTVDNKNYPIDYIELDKNLIGSNRIWIENKNEIKILSHISEDGSCWVHTLRRK